MKTGKEKTESERKSIMFAFYKAFKSFGAMTPVLLGVVLLMGLFKTWVTPQMITSAFTGELFQDTLLGSVTGSILTGNPITSYIIGGELLKSGISLFAVTAFIVAWVTVGVVQLPAEAAILGKRFAFARNELSFLSAVLVSIATVLTIEVVT